MAKTLARCAGEVPVIGVHCHDDLGLATANSLAALHAGAGHVEVTIGGFGERAGNAALEEVAFLLSAFGERDGLSHGIDLAQIGPTSRLFESLTGVRTHPNKAVIGQSALVPVAGGFPGASLEPRLRDLLQEKTIGRTPDDLSSSPPQPSGPYALEAYNVLSSSHAPPVGLVVIRRGGKTLTQTSHGTGPIDALFSAVDKALGFSTRMVLYSVSTLCVGNGGCHRGHRHRRAARPQVPRKAPQHRRHRSEPQGLHGRVQRDRRIGDPRRAVRVPRGEYLWE